MTPLEVLKGARALIENPKNWTQKTFARDILGDCVWPTNEAACAFCAYGAMVRASTSLCSPNRMPNETEIVMDARRHLERFTDRRGYASITTFNDFLGVVLDKTAIAKRHTEVLEVFDEAIAELS